MALLGVKELKADLRKLGRLEATSLRKAAYAGAAVVRDETRRGTPRGTGRRTGGRSYHGVQGIVAVPSRAQRGVGHAKVGFTPAAFYLLILNVGAKAHPIKAQKFTRIVEARTLRRLGKRRKARAALAFKPFAGSELVLFRGKVEHPVLRPRRFFEAGFDRAETRAGDVMAEKLGQEVDKVLRRVHGA